MKKNSINKNRLSMRRDSIRNLATVVLSRARGGFQVTGDDTCNVCDPSIACGASATCGCGTGND